MKQGSKEIIRLRKQFTHQFFRHNWGNFYMAIFTTILAALTSLCVSWIMQQIIDTATGAESRFTIGQLTFITVVFVCAQIIVMFIDYKFRPKFLERAMQQYKDYSFEGIVKKSIHSFNGENTATYISALSNDANSIETNYLAKIFTLVQESIMFIGAFAMMIYYSPSLTLVAFLLSLFPVIGAILTGNRLAEQEKIVSEKNEGFIGTIKDMLNGFSVIKSFKAEKEVRRLFSESNTAAEHAKCKRRKLEVIIQTIGLIAGIIAQFGVFLFGGYLAISGKGVTAGVIIVFVQLMNYVIMPIGEIPQILANRKSAYALIDKLAEAINSNQRREGQMVDNKLDTAIEVRNLSYSYKDNDAVLNNISMTFEAGKSYAIVGGSGSGKSTLLNLLIGSSEDYEGEIRFDGDEIRSISSDSLYDLVSIVQQNVFVFNSSVLNNVTMFRNFDMEELEQALNMSGLSSFIEERGTDYLCGENGCGLSGGERQRISIARCLLRGTPVVLVDEATAALDAETAFSVTNSILDIKGLTRIIVTHRLEEPLLQKYDEIFVLRNGQVDENGSFDELMEKKGYFYSLYTVSQ